MGVRLGRRPGTRPFRREASAHAGASHFLGNLPPGRGLRAAGSSRRAACSSGSLPHGVIRILSAPPISRDARFVGSSPKNLQRALREYRLAPGTGAGSCPQSSLAASNRPELQPSPISAGAIAKTSRGGTAIAAGRGRSSCKPIKGAAHQVWFSVQGSKRPTRRPSELFPVVQLQWEAVI